MTVVEIRGDKIRLGVVADRQTPVHRAEIQAEVNSGKTLLQLAIERRDRLKTALAEADAEIVKLMAAQA